METALECSTDRNYIKHKVVNSSNFSSNKCKKTLIVEKLENMF